MTHREPTMSGGPEAWAADEALSELLRWRNPIPAVKSQLADEPDAMWAHTLWAYLDLVSMDPRFADSARRRIAALASLEAGPADRRNRQHLDVLRSWAAGDLVEAAEQLSQISVAEPADLLALWMGHQLRFFLGDVNGNRRQALVVLAELDPGHPLRGFVEGIAAFAIEEAGDPDVALDLAWRALERNRDDVWAIHAIAHALDHLGRFDDGADVMSDTEPVWAADNVLVSHNAVHTMVFLLELQRLDDALAHYDAHIDPAACPNPAVSRLIDGSSAMWRLHLEGVDDPSRCAGLAHAWWESDSSVHYAFNDVHAMFAYVAAGDWDNAQALRSSLAASIVGSGRPTHNRVVTSTFGLPMCDAILAFGQHRYRDAVERLEALRPRFHEAGGSETQRDVYERTLLEAAIRSGHRTLADSLISARRSSRPASTYAQRKERGLPGIGTER